MDAAHENRRQLGQLMVDEGFLTPEQLAIALAEQSRTERPLGAILVELGFVSAGAVANALAEQHGGLLKTEFGVSAGLYALPGGATRQAVAAAARDPVAARTHELETQLQAVLTERNAFSQRVNEQAVRLSEAAQAHDAEVARITDAAAAHIAKLEAELQAALAGDATVGRDELQDRLSEAAQAHDAEVARVTDAAAAHIAKLEDEVKTALASRDELISELQREVAELREQAPDEATVGQDELEARLSEAAQTHEAEVARVTDAAAARIAELEAEVQLALAGRDELVSELQHEVADLREQAEQRQDEHAPDEATVGRAHLLFVPSASGYALIEFPGPDPPSGTLLDVDGVGYVVRRIGASPFPGSRLRCVFVEPV